MCELFAMSSRAPATVTFSLEALSRHGGADGPHRDGWGVAFFEGGDARVLRETEAASDSPLVRFIESHGPCSTLVISHIRKATLGEKTLANTQPFARPLGGRLHVFAHNGHLKEIFARPEFAIGNHRPLGDTDSEWAFCALLRRLEAIWQGGDAEPPAPSRRFALLNTFASELRALGMANFLYSDGELLFAHGHRRNQPDGSIVPPGLHRLQRQCGGVSGDVRSDGVELDTPAQTVTLIASVPLTGEAWLPLHEGEMLMIRNGEVIAAAQA